MKRSKADWLGAPCATHLRAQTDRCSQEVSEQRGRGQNAQVGVCFTQTLIIFGHQTSNKDNFYSEGAKGIQMQSMDCGSCEAEARRETARFEAVNDLQWSCDPNDVLRRQNVNKLIAGNK